MSRAINVLGHHPAGPTAILCSGSEPLNHCPLRIAITEGSIHVHETLVINYHSEGAPDRICFVTTSPHNRLPVRGRIQIFGIHLGTYYKRLRELGNDRYQQVVIHVYMTHRKPGRLFDLHFGDGYLLPGFSFDVPIVDHVARKSVIGQPTSLLPEELNAIPGLTSVDAKDLLEKASRASRQR